MSASPAAGESAGEGRRERERRATLRRNSIMAAVAQNLEVMGDNNVDTCVVGLDHTDIALVKDEHDRDTEQSVMFAHTKTQATTNKVVDVIEASIAFGRMVLDPDSKRAKQKKVRFHFVVVPCPVVRCAPCPSCWSTRDG